MVAVLKPITARVIQQPRYVVADTYAQWLRLNHATCWDYFGELDEKNGGDAERAGQIVEFMDFAKAQFDVHCASLTEDEDEESAPRVHRTNDERDAYEAGSRARGEI